jgi:hypothetical protein
MKRLLGTLMALACALGASAAVAQSVQRDGATVGSAGNPGPAALPQAVANSPMQLAQASSAPGGAAAGASAGGAAAGVGFGTALIVVGAAVATIAVTVNSGSTVAH